MSECHDGRYTVTETMQGIIIGDRQNEEAYIEVQYDEDADRGNVPPWMIQCVSCGDWRPPEKWGVDQDVCGDCIKEELLFDWAEEGEIE